MKAGPAENGTGGRGRIVRKSYTLTRGSGNGRDCLVMWILCQQVANKTFYAHLSPIPIVKTKLPAACNP